MQNDSIPIKASAIALGETVSIRLKTGSGEPEAFLMGDIVASTPKAVRMQLIPHNGPGRRVWLPRRALTHLVRDRNGVQSAMARWWAPNEAQAPIIDACRHTGEGAW